MKIPIIILTGLFLLTIASCKKEEVRPNTSDSNANYLMIKPDDNRGQPDVPDKNISSYSRDIIVIINDSSFTITDPNRDEDDDRKTKRK